MRRAIFNGTIFLAAFFAGTFVAFSWINLMEQSEQFDRKIIRPIEVEDLVSPTTSIDEPSLFNPDVNYSQQNKVKLLQTGAFHSEEVPYRTGEKWLGLFRVGNRYELKWTTIINKQIKNDELFDREISTRYPRKSIFLLRGAHDLQTGPIKSVFDDIDGEGLFDFSASKGFGVRGQFWWLSLEKAGENDMPQKGTSLVIRQTGYDPQVLRTLPNGCNDCSWRLLWVGDLNRDQSLDFLIDVSDHYNAYEPTLFMSSHGNGYAVYASFRGVGC